MDLLVNLMGIIGLTGLTGVGVGTGLVGVGMPILLLIGILDGPTGGKMDDRARRNSGH